MAPAQTTAASDETGTGETGVNDARVDEDRAVDVGADAPVTHAPVTPDDIRRTILALAAPRGPAKTICPSEAARALHGADEKRWRLLMKPIRAEAVRMADEGLVEIRRKNRPVDPHAFKGVYRIAIR